MVNDVGRRETRRTRETEIQFCHGHHVSTTVLSFKLQLLCVSKVP